MTSYYREVKNAFLMDEVEKVRQEIQNVECKIEAMEEGGAYHNDPRYLRLVNEKKLVMEHLFSLRLLLASGVTSDYSPSARTQQYLIPAGMAPAPADPLPMVEADVNKRSRSGKLFQVLLCNLIDFSATAMEGNVLDLTDRSKCLVFPDEL